MGSSAFGVTRYVRFYLGYNSGMENQRVSNDVVLESLLRNLERTIAEAGDDRAAATAFVQLAAYVRRLSAAQVADKMAIERLRSCCAGLAPKACV